MELTKQQVALLLDAIQKHEKVILLEKEGWETMEEFQNRFTHAYAALFCDASSVERDEASETAKVVLYDHVYHVGYDKSIYGNRIEMWACR